jgi:hypothetical protein
MAAKVYMMVLMDNASDNYDYGLPYTENSYKAYGTLSAAKAALEEAAAKFEEFLPTAYGKAFPYDITTFEQMLEKDDFAPWGWGVMNTEDGMMRICIGLVSITLE